MVTCDVTIAKKLGLAKSYGDDKHFLAIKYSLIKVCTMLS